MAILSEDLIITLVSSIMTLTIGFILKLHIVAAKYISLKNYKIYGLIELISLLAIVLSGILIIIVLLMWLATS